MDEKKLESIYEQEWKMALEFEKVGLFKKPNCTKCYKTCKLTTAQRTKGERKRLTWRCGCGKPYSLFEGSIFGNRKKPFYEMLQYIKCWSVVLTITKALEIQKFDCIETCRQTIGDFYQSLRNVCTIALEKKDFKLGGEGKIVEIDESLLL